ncbi:hypothetical protein ACHQM5_001452 [Ranunculus cassubicifolius]
MVLHLVALAKLKLQCLTHFTSTAFTFALVMLLLKLPASSRQLHRVCNKVFTASRLFLFRFGIIIFEDGSNGGIEQRWERAVRLVRERLITNRGNNGSSDNHEDSLLAVSMVAL